MRSELKEFWDAGRYARRFAGLIVASGILAALIMLAAGRAHR